MADGRGVDAGEKGDLSAEEIAELRALANGGEATALEWRAAALAAHPFLLNEVEHFRAAHHCAPTEQERAKVAGPVAGAEGRGWLTDEEQADQDLAMQWANETIQSWRNTYDLIRRIRADTRAALAALLAEMLADAPETPEEKAALDKLQREPADVLAKAKERAK